MFERYFPLLFNCLMLASALSLMAFPVLAQDTNQLSKYRRGASNDTYEPCAGHANRPELKRLQDTATRAERQLISLDAWALAGEFDISLRNFLDDFRIPDPCQAHEYRTRFDLRTRTIHTDPV